MRLSMTVALASTLITGTASAQPYVSGHIGHASADFSLDSPYNGVVDDKSLLLGVDVGMGFGLWHRWAVELGVDKYRGFDGRGTPCVQGQACSQVVQSIDDNDVRVVTLAAVPRFKVGKTWLYAKAGYYRARIDTPIGPLNDKFTKNGVLLGLGIRWYFRRPWSVSLEGERFDNNLSQLNVGVGWGLKATE